MNEPAAQQVSIRKRLGRGLGSLLSTPVQIEIRPPKTSLSQTSAAKAEMPVDQPMQPEGDASIRMIDLARIQPNPLQPRQHFDEDALEALAKSIRTSGVMQPIIVRPASPEMKLQSGEFQIVAGERRWRAAQLAGLAKIPAIIRALDHQTAAEFSLIENVQREDLNPMERAEAFRRLIEEFDLTHQEIAERVGLDRSTVTNLLRLNDLDHFCQDAIRFDRLSLGHAKVLLGITNLDARSELAKETVREGWSVRELERRVQAKSAGAFGDTKATNPQQKPHPVSANVASLEKSLAQILGTKVILRPGPKKNTGKITIEFYSLEQFEDLVRLLGLKID